MSATAAKARPSVERRAREREMLRREILDAARRLFVHEGYENVSMRRIAEKIGYSPTTIYLYFKDKGELIFALCEETFTRLAEQLREIENSPGDPVENLKKGLRVYVDFGLNHPQHYLLALVFPHAEWEDRARYTSPDSMGMKAFGFLGRGVETCVRQGRFRQVDVRAASQALWAAMHGVTSLLITHQQFPWVKKDDLVESVLDAAVEFLKA